MANDTVLKAIEEGECLLKTKGARDPRLDAELLMAFLLRLNRIEVYLEAGRLLSEAELTKYKNLLEQRGKKIPLEDFEDDEMFHNLPLRFNAAVFVPHKRTEVLVDKAVRLLSHISDPQVIDIGTGSGAIGIAIAYYVSQAQVWATDISQSAVDLALKNGVRIGVQDRVKVLQGSLFEGLPASIKGDVDLIISNPPFRPLKEIDSLEESYDFKPSKAAQMAGQDGLDYHRAIAKEAPRYLKRGGWLILEIDLRNRDSVTKIFDAVWSPADIMKDDKGLACCVMTKLVK